MSPWDEDPPQPENASRISWFRQHVDIPSSAVHPRAHTVFSASCEVLDHEICLPSSSLVISSSGSYLALAGIEEYDRVERPAISYWCTDVKGYLDERQIHTGLAYPVKHSVIDDTRKLLFFADKDRIKSFHWGEGLPVHTMRSGNFDGPLAVMTGGRLARAGKGYAAIWNLDALETHGKSGEDAIGEGNYRVRGYTFMDPYDIDLSIGSVVHTTTKFADSDFQPFVWHSHTPTSYMLCAEAPRWFGHHNCDSTHEHGFVTFDLAQGKTVSRFSGLDCEPEAFSTSEDEPNTFMTAGSVGHAWLYDIRLPVPQKKILARCPIALAHLDGIPVLFIGGSDKISLYDLRAEKVVYDLATGNNEVTSLAWETCNSSLYASTLCPYVDDQGYRYRSQYRPYKPPKPRRVADRQTETEEDDFIDSDEDSSDDDYTRAGWVDWDKCWPTIARSEGYFRHEFDAREHRLYCYRFKADAKVDPGQLRLPIT
ncbi:hypothetical protein EIP86_007636 [Pleurotus ostreatoroseus]|nr:hypothetical protein EIP86_007636 [Pleurotus ostreatoroseus]